MVAVRSRLEGAADEAPAIVLPSQRSRISHLAIDIGGSLIKMVYFSRPGDAGDGCVEGGGLGAGGCGASIGRMHFVRFETAKISECLDFIQAKRLHLDSGSPIASVGAAAAGASDEGGRRRGDAQVRHVTINATGGGAHKFKELFHERLGLELRKLDEMECLVAGANFLLRAVRDEAFAYTRRDGRQYVRLYPDAPPGSADSLFPYLLVNIGSGVSIVRVDGPGNSTRISGSTLGGGAFWGLCRLLTGCETFDEMLELSKKVRSRKTCGAVDENRSDNLRGNLTA